MMDSCEGARKGIEEVKLKDGENVSAQHESCQLPITCFTEIVNDASLHFQIIQFPKQIYVWVGYTSAKLGNLYAAAHTRPNNNVSITSLMGGTSDNTGSGLACRLVLKTGLNVILACNIPKNSPMIEAEAEKILVQKLNSMGYGMKLVLHPSGNKGKNIKDHVSLYLALDEASLPHPAWEIYANFRLFLLDQNTDNYLVVQDATGKERRFYKMKAEWGFDKFITLKEFNDASKGYLVDDTCAFGAEVYVCKERSRSKGESIVMVKDSFTYKHVWEINNYSKLDLECYDSKTFNAGSYEWKIKLYPKGNGPGFGSHLSLYLALSNPSTLSPVSKIYAQITLRILDQKQAKHHFGKANYWFSSSNHERGASRLIPLSYFTSQYQGFLVKDSCLVEAEVQILGVVEALS
ncbi:hypothetical protein Ahy_A01g000516 [Arachis hypogaea]|uniref:MATH domain-containing protein n=1 Tax=Arachis hypogaea TaxID=3818 RepID=A0A445EKF0_ARAHY|nr:hypothetical protein Ahy_A01g000516 [Arachis hypogaea]